MVNLTPIKAAEYRVGRLKSGSDGTFIRKLNDFSSNIAKLDYFNFALPIQLIFFLD